MLSSEAFVDNRRATVRRGRRGATGTREIRIRVTAIVRRKGGSDSLRMQLILVKITLRNAPSPSQDSLYRFPDLMKRCF